MAVIPAETAVNACSIWTNFPEGENVVREKAYLDSLILYFFTLRKRQDNYFKPETTSSP